MPEIIRLARRQEKNDSGQLEANEAGQAMVAPGLGIIREVAVADIDFTSHASYSAFGHANALEVIAGTGTLTITGPDGQDVTLGTNGALAVGWSVSGLCIMGLKTSGSTVTYVRVRW